MAEGEEEVLERYRYLQDLTGDMATKAWGRAKRMKKRYEEIRDSLRVPLKREVRMPKPSMWRKMFGYGGPKLRDYDKLKDTLSEEERKKGLEEIEGRALAPEEFKEGIEEYNPEESKGPGIGKKVKSYLEEARQKIGEGKFSDYVELAEPIDEYGYAGNKKRMRARLEAALKKYGSDLSLPVEHIEPKGPRKSMAQEAYTDRMLKPRSIYDKSQYASEHPRRKAHKVAVDKNA